MGYTTLTCAQAKRCGGCEWLSVPYPLQLKRMHAALVELYAPVVAKRVLKDFTVYGMNGAIATAAGAEERVTKEEAAAARAAAAGEGTFPLGFCGPAGTVPAGYRTKAATPFAPLAKGRIARGFYERNSHKIAPCPSCLAEAPHARETLEAVAQVAEALHVRAYDEDRGRGILRAAICRVGWHSNEALLTLITNGDTLPQLEAFLGRLLEQAPWLTSVCQNVNVRKTNALLGPVTRTLAGPGYLTDSLLGTQFHVGPTSFYQTNPCATELLYAKALEGAALAPGMRVLDTYAGIGTIGLCAAHATSGIELTLVEKNAEAVRFARENARLNGLEAHTRCIADDATAWIRHESKVGGLCTSGFDVVIMDPARAGSTPEFISHVCALAPERVVYVSCNPTTHVRDLALFRERGWQVQSLCAVDLFAHTTHAESIAILGR